MAGVDRVVQVMFDLPGHVIAVRHVAPNLLVYELSSPNTQQRWQGKKQNTSISDVP